MKESITKKTLREFGFLIGFGFPILIGWILPTLIGHGFRLWTLWIGIPGIILGISAPRMLYYPYKFWMALGHLLGWVNSRIILGLVFVFVLMPIAFVMRLFGYDPLQRKDAGSKTYRENKQGQVTDLKRIF